MSGIDRKILGQRGKGEGREGRSRGLKRRREEGRKEGREGESKKKDTRKEERKAETKKKEDKEINRRKCKYENKRMR